MSINSKNKGSRFERKIGAWFTQWTGFKFERNRAGSGAWHSNKDATSDLTCTDENMLIAVRYLSNVKLQRYQIRTCTAWKQNL